METVQSIRASLQQFEWVVKLDLKDAFLLYRFFRPSGSTSVSLSRIQFTSSNRSPLACLQLRESFTKTLAPLVRLLRLQGIKVHAYLDDWLYERTQNFRYTVSRHYDL